MKASTVERQSEPLALVIDQYGYVGGGQIVLMEVLSSLLNSGIRPTLIAPKGGELEKQISGHFTGAVEMLHQDPSSLSIGKKTAWDVFRLLSEAMAFTRKWRAQAKSATLIYANGSRWFLAAAMLSRVSRNPLVLHLHLRFSFIENVLITLCVLLSKRPTIVANSDYTAQSAGKFLSFWKTIARVKVIENCLPRNCQVLEYRSGTELSHDGIECVVMGQLCPEKGQDIVVNALRDVPAVKVHLLGRVGPNSEQWVAKLLENLPPNVVYHDATSDVPAFLRREGIYANIVPSRRESFGLVAIEGMANSCLTIVSNGEALPTIAKKTGALVFDGTVQGLRTTFKELCGHDREHLEQLRRSQYEKVKLEYSTSRFQRELELLFSSLV